MRVIAGTLGGRQFSSPKSPKTHPMSDKARGALFNVLGDISGLDILDPFAGTGAFSFEAVSRGAASSIAIEQDKLAQRIIQENIQTLQLSEHIKLVKAGAGAWLKTNPTATFDLVLCDPPYNDLQPNLLEQLAGRITADGVFVLSWPDGVVLPALPLELLQHKKYGDATLAFYGSHA
jgi:16S rRNA (guanine966-N2)-methyltransferase